MSKNSSKSLISGVIGFFESVGVPALVSVAVSTGMAAYFESRLENSKDHVAAIMKGKEEFDASQVNIFGKLGIFTKAVLLKKGSMDRDELYSAIVAAQIQIARLKNEIKSSEGSALDEYATELEKLRSEIADVKSKNDLNQVYDSAQKILALHDRVTDEVRSKMQVSLF